MCIIVIGSHLPHILILRDLLVSQVSQETLQASEILGEIIEKLSFVGRDTLVGNSEGAEYSHFLSPSSVFVFWF